MVVILVTGSTGVVGRAVVDRLVTSNVAVRAITRDPSRAALPAAADVVRADAGNASTLAAVFDDVDRVLLISSGPDLAGQDRAVVTAAAAAGVEHIVKVSSGRVGDVTAHDPIPMWHRAGERSVRASGMSYTMLRPLGFMSNALHWAHSVRTQGVVQAPYGAGRISAVDPVDIAAVATSVLTNPAAHARQAYLLTGPQALSIPDQVSILSDVLDRPLCYVDADPEDARQSLLNVGVEAIMADAIMALRAEALESFTSTVTHDVEDIAGRQPRTFREWAAAHRGAFQAPSPS